MSGGIGPDEAAIVMRAYLSALLISTVAFKDRLLAATALSEDRFMAGWRSAFDYGPDDIRRFDEAFVPAFRANGMDSLIEALGRTTVNSLFEEKGPLNGEEKTFFLNMIAEDANAIKRCTESAGS